MDGTRSRPPSERRVAIADAAIAILADSGSRGLTHRAIDRALELPEGSTSAYARTRSSLLIAATNRLAELDRASIADLAGRLPADATSPGEWIAAIIDEWTTPATAARQLARIELQLEATRTPAVAEVLATQRLAFIELTRDTLIANLDGSAGHTSVPDGIPGVLTALVDGLITDRLLHPRTAVPTDNLASALNQLLSVS
ncbi:MAG: TetR family transcriptional regulator [Rhodococcus sp.]|nr:TetR family transcriptional regulator [Rhodococcus sp. (in: high G+C Gram-positive bacteria)]